MSSKKSQSTKGSKQTKLISQGGHPFTANIPTTITGEGEPTPRIYYTMSSINHQKAETAVPQQTAFFEKRQSPIISNTNSWDVAITKFSINHDLNIPAWIPTILDPQNNSNETIYSLTLEATRSGTTHTAQRQVQWQAQNLSANPPQNQVGTQQEYYHAYTISHAVELFNDTLNLLLNDLETDFGNPGDLPITFIRYLQSENKFKIYRQELVSPVSDFKIFFGVNTRALFAHFPFEIFQGRNATDKKVYLIGIKDLGINKETVDGNNYITHVQEEGSLSTVWSPYSSIIFTSQALPVTKELVAEPTQYGTSTGQVSGINTGDHFESVITELTLAPNSPLDFTQFIIYLPETQYRWITLHGGSKDLNSVDISVWLKERMTGQVVPLNLGNQGSAEMTLLFQKKNRVFQ